MKLSFFFFFKRTTGIYGTIKKNLTGKEERKIEAEKVFEKIMTKTFPSVF